jgi:hypothetical protein
MPPYRSPREERAAPAAPPPGLVADMVQQFADPYAFLRELVQNGLGAGARRIGARVERMHDGVASTSVSDDGCGMSREVIEGPLLTLFSSSKEGDDDTIGKYGVGFVSVFALTPERVEVRGLPRDARGGDVAAGCARRGHEPRDHGAPPLAGAGGAARARRVDGRRPRAAR